MDVPFGVTAGRYANSTVMFRGYMTEKTGEGTLRALETCGVDTSDVTRMDLADVTKNEVEIVVVTETDRSGRTQTRVRWVNPLPDGVPGPHPGMDTDEFKRLAAKFSAKSSGVSGASAADTVGNEDPGDGSTDSIPY